MEFQFLVRLRTYSLSSVNSVVETSQACWLSAVTDVHHRGTERTEDSRRLLLFYHPLDTARNRISFTLAHLALSIMATPPGFARRGCQGASPGRATTTV